MSISCVSFHGHGTESTGSIAHRNNPNQCPTCGKEISFKARDTYGEDKGMSTGGIIATVVGLTATAIIGLGYAHKAEVFNKMKDGKVKDLVLKLKPACEKCHEWCATAKTKSIECWDKLKNMFSKK